MILICVFILELIVPVTSNTIQAIPVNRGKEFDEITYNEDCKLFNAYRRGTSKTQCSCVKNITENAITTILNGFLCPDGDGFAKCLYNFRETGMDLRYSFLGK